MAAAGYVPQHKVSSASSSGSLGFIVCVRCCRIDFVQPSSLKGFLVLFLWILLLFPLPLNCLKQTVDSILTHTAFSLGGSSSMALALCSVVTQWLAGERLGSFNNIHVFLVDCNHGHCNLLHIPRFPSQRASNIGGLVIN